MMKFCIILLLLLSTARTHAQESPFTYYYDWELRPCSAQNAIFRETGVRDGNRWKVTTYYTATGSPYRITYTTDDSLKIYDGLTYFYYQNGQTWSKGYYKEGKLHGRWENWHESGKLLSIMHYYKNYYADTSIKWYENGVVSDTIIFDTLRNGRWSIFYENGKLKARSIAHQDTTSWTFYYPDGKLWADYQQLKDSVTKIACYGKDGKQSPSCTFMTEASFSDNESEWKQYISRNLGSASILSLPSGTELVALVRFEIDEKGYVRNVHLYKSSGNKIFDKRALNVIKRSPRWRPSILLNQPIPAYRMQPITFIN